MGHSVTAEPGRISFKMDGEMVKCVTKQIKTSTCRFVEDPAHNDPWHFLLFNLTVKFHFNKVYQHDVKTVL